MSFRRVTVVVPGATLVSIVGIVSASWSGVSLARRRSMSSALEWLYHLGVPVADIPALDKTQIGSMLREFGLVAGE